MRRSAVLLTAVAIVTAACVGGDTDDPQGEEAPPTSQGTGQGTDQQRADQPVAATTAPIPDEPVRATSSGCEDVRFYWQDDGCEPATMIDLDEVVEGGPPPDGIPPIDDPQFESVDEAGEWLEDDSPVMVVEVGDDVRAYPLAILTWHEIVNDQLDGVPVVVTYCQLCNSGLAFERTIEDDGEERVLDFGTSGRLLRSNLLMYDRQTASIWSQFEGQALIGEELLQTELERLPAWLLGFDEFARSHPDAPVLSRETGNPRDYGRNPYQGYDATGGQPFLFEGETDDRFPPMTRVVGLDIDDDPVAVVLEALASDRVVELEAGGDDVVVLWTPGQASALDTSSIDQGRDVGQTGAYRPVAGGERVQLEPDGDGFIDRTSGSRFDVRGRALDGPLAGERLEPIIHDDTFWFVWTSFRGDSRVLS